MKSTNTLDPEARKKEIKHTNEYSQFVTGVTEGNYDDEKDENKSKG